MVPAPGRVPTGIGGTGQTGQIRPRAVPQPCGVPSRRRIPPQQVGVRQRIDLIVDLIEPGDRGQTGPDPGPAVTARDIKENDDAAVAVTAAGHPDRHKGSMSYRKGPVPTATSLHELTKTNYQLFQTVNPGADMFPGLLVRTK